MEKEEKASKLEKLVYFSIALCKFTQNSVFSDTSNETSKRHTHSCEVTFHIFKLQAEMI
jgi:hypothetical protein